MLLTAVFGHEGENGIRPHWREDGGDGHNGEFKFPVGMTPTKSVQICGLLTSNW
jgi:hypothetical protein